MRKKIKMSFLTTVFLGVRLLYWIYLLLSLICAVMAVVVWKRDQIKQAYYKWRFPEKVIKIVVHYPGGLYKVYWRLIPDGDDFEIDGKLYHFNAQYIEKENDFYVRKREDQLVARIKDKEYILDDKLKIRNKDKSYPELHYIDNVPVPIDFLTVDNSKLQFNGKELDDFKRARMFEELLTLEGKKNLMMIIILIGIGNLIVSLFIVAKLMGWVK